MKLYGNERDVARVGQPLVAFEGGDDDTGTVVGKVEVGQKVMADAPTAATPLAHGIKATPAVRAMARKLNIDLAKWPRVGGLCARVGERTAVIEAMTVEGLVK